MISNSGDDFSALGDDETAGSYRGSLVSETPTSKPTLCSNLAGFLRRHLLPIALGQLLSALLCITSITSTYLVNFNVNLPIAQNLSHYVLLGLVYSSIVLWRLLSAHSTSSSFWKFLRCRGWQYALVGTIDVHANWAIVSAYDYTNMTSIQLLDCLAIPAAMMLSFFCLKTRYRWIHIVGVLVCLGGAGAMVLADFLAAKDTEATTNTTVSRSSSSVLFGDFLVIVAALGYGSSNVYQEYLVRRYGIVDYLSCTSVVAMVWAAIYTLTMERGTIDQLIAIYDQPNLVPIIGCFVGFALAMFLLYTVMPIALSRTNAVLVNLSLLTADIYALLVGVLLFGNRFHPLYLGAFAAIVIGLGLFTARDPIFKGVKPDLIDEEKEEVNDDDIDTPVKKDDLSD